MVYNAVLTFFGIFTGLQYIPCDARMSVVMLGISSLFLLWIHWSRLPTQEGVSSYPTKPFGAKMALVAAFGYTLGIAISPLFPLLAFYVLYDVYELLFTVATATLVLFLVFGGAFSRFNTRGYIYGISTSIAAMIWTLYTLITHVSSDTIINTHIAEFVYILIMLLSAFIVANNEDLISDIERTKQYSESSLAQDAITHSTSIVPNSIKILISAGRTVCSKLNGIVTGIFQPENLQKRAGGTPSSVTPTPGEQASTIFIESITVVDSIANDNKDRGQSFSVDPLRKRPQTTNSGPSGIDKDVPKAM